MTKRGRTRSRKGASGPRLRILAPSAAGRDTGAHVGPDPDVRVSVADAFELAASRIRQNGLALFADRLADGQPDRLAPMPTTQDPPTNGDALLTQQDLAAYLGCNVRTLRRWGHEGRIPEPFLSIGRVQRWRRRDVDRWLEGAR